MVVACILLVTDSDLVDEYVTNSLVYVDSGLCGVVPCA